MNKIKKKILTSVLVFTFLLTIGSTALATTGPFYFYIVKGDRGISTAQIKDDYEQKAYITVLETNVGCCANDFMHLRVRTSSGQFATSAISTKNVGSYTTPYSVLYGQAGSSYKLYGQFDDASIHGSGRSQGRWTP